MRESEHFKPLKWEDLSSIQHSAYDYTLEGSPPLGVLVLRYSGEYGHGSAGKSDALYVVATAKAAREAWRRDGLVLDFTGLEYQWGDEMGWVLDIGWDPLTKCSRPVAIVVGEGCRDGLRSLEEGSDPSVLVETFQAACHLIRRGIEDYERCLKQFRRTLRD